MGILSRAADTYYTYRFLRLLTSKWEDIPAFKLGIIDRNGKLIKKTNTLTGEEKAEYTLFHRLVFNLKVALDKLPISNTLSSYAAALYLLRENYSVDISNLIIKDNLPKEELKESWFVSNGVLSPGIYKLLTDVLSPTTGNLIPMKGIKVKIDESNNKPIDKINGLNLYKIKCDYNEHSYFITSIQLEKLNAIDKK